jgi:hypothetical protein
MSKQKMPFTLNDNGKALNLALVKFVTNNVLDLGILAMLKNRDIDGRWVSLDDDDSKMGEYGPDPGVENSEDWLYSLESLQELPITTLISSSLSIVDPDLVIPTAQVVDFFSGLILYALGADSTTHDFLDLALYVAMTKNSAGDVRLFRPDLHVTSMAQRQVVFLIELMTYLLSFEFAPLADHSMRELSAKISAVMYGMDYHFAHMSFQMTKTVHLVDDARAVFEKRIKTHPVIVGLKRSGELPPEGGRWREYLTSCASHVDANWRVPDEIITFGLAPTNKIELVKAVLAANLDRLTY